MTDDQILELVKSVYTGWKDEKLATVIDALEDRLAVQNWACGDDGELNIPDDE